MRQSPRRVLGEVTITGKSTQPTMQTQVDTTAASQSSRDGLLQIEL